MPRWPNIHDSMFTFIYEGLLMTIWSPKNDRFQLNALDLVEALDIYNIKKLFKWIFEILAWYQGGADSLRISQNYRIYLLIIIYCRTYLAIVAGQFLISRIGFLPKVLELSPLRNSTYCTINYLLLNIPA